MSKKLSRENMKEYFKKLGVIGIIFFTLKGLVWLAVFYFVGDAVSCN